MCDKITVNLYVYETGGIYIVDDVANFQADYIVIEAAVLFAVAGDVKSTLEARTVAGHAFRHMFPCATFNPQSIEKC